MLKAIEFSKEDASGADELYAKLYKAAMDLQKAQIAINSKLKADY